MICVVVLQNCVDFVEDGTGSDSETFVMFDVDGTKEVCIKVEEALDIKDEIPEAISFPPIKTEHEVRLCGVCEVVAAHVFRPIISDQGSCYMTLNYFQLCVTLCVPYTF